MGRWIWQVLSGVERKLDAVENVCIIRTSAADAVVKLSEVLDFKAL
jgi:hypothetical protein